MTGNQETAPITAAPGVSLVIPGRNCAATIGPCLDAVVPLLDDPASRLHEILFVDDGSTDDTATIVGRYPVRLIRGAGQGPGDARNRGWQAAGQPLTWFVDSDCVAEPDALRRLLPHLDDPAVGGVSGSYGNMNTQSLTACLIHEEIVARHRRMPRRVDFLFTANVLYRRVALEKVGGFDQRYLKAQDAELSFRVQQAGYVLEFCRASRVGHFHETRLLRYLRTQRAQGYYRVWLHLAYPRHTFGDAYSSFVDHVQPPLAVVSVAGLALLLIPHLAWLAALPFVLLAVAQLPLTARLVRQTQRPALLAFVSFSFLRAYWRAAGMTAAAVDYVRGRRR